MPSPALRRRLGSAACLAILACLLFPSRASADITIAQKDSLPRVNSAGVEIRKRALNFTPEGISFQDCVDDQGIRFTLQLSTPPEANASLEAWASLGGADCSQQTARTGGVAVCWRILTGIQLSTNPVAILPVRKIISGRNNGRVASLGPDDAIGDISVCGTVPLSTITVQFLYFPPGNPATASQVAPINISANTIGPAAPTGLTILPGDTRLTITFDALGEGGVVQLSTVQAFCDPNPGTGGTTTPGTTQTICDAAIADAADEDAIADAAVDACTTVVTDGSSTPAQACSSAAFTPSDGGKLLPDQNLTNMFGCGSLPVSATGTTLIARDVAGAPLQNGHTYAVALAATDSFLNVGPLSAVKCEFPEPTHDFWQDYKNAGGGAGGGFCSVETPGVPVGSFTLFGIVVVLGTSVWRRKHRATRAPRRNGR